MMNLIGMDSFADVTAGLRARLPAWIDRIEGGHKPRNRPGAAPSVTPVAGRET
jgi:hypothetical protein